MTVELEVKNKCALFLQLLCPLRVGWGLMTGACHILSSSQGLGDCFNSIWKRKKMHLQFFLFRHCVNGTLWTWL